MRMNTKNTFDVPTEEPFEDTMIGLNSVTASPVQIFIEVVASKCEDYRQNKTLLT